MHNVLDLLRARGIEPKKASGREGGEYASPCPGCGGDDRFHVWPEQNGGDGSWWCRACGKGGDNIQFLIEFEENMDFKKACEVLGRKLEDWKPRSREARAPQAWKPQVYQEPEQLWQEKARALVQWAHEQLLRNKEQLAWLEARGLPRGAVEMFSLGWNPGEKGKDLYRPRKSWGLHEERKENGQLKKLWLPRGLIIPCCTAQRVLRIRIRRVEDWGPKFFVLPGSSSATLVARPNAKAFVVTESEMDAMACAWATRETRPKVGAVAVLTNRGKPDATAAKALTGAMVLVALDFDQLNNMGQRPGAMGWPWWREQYGVAARRWPVPSEKDPGDFAKAGGELEEWVLAGLPPVWSIGPSPLESQSRGRRVMEWPEPDAAATDVYRALQADAAAMGIRIKLATGKKPEPVYPEDLAARLKEKEPDYPRPEKLEAEWRESFELGFKDVVGEVERLLKKGEGGGDAVVAR